MVFLMLKTILCPKMDFLPESTDRRLLRFFWQSRYFGSETWVSRKGMIQCICDHYTAVLFGDYCTKSWM